MKRCIFPSFSMMMKYITENCLYHLELTSLSVSPPCVYFALFATKVRSCGQPRQSGSPADIQSGRVIMAAALISWVGLTWTLSCSTTDNPPGGLGNTRWPNEQFKNICGALIYSPFRPFRFFFSKTHSNMTLNSNLICNPISCISFNILICLLRKTI